MVLALAAALTAKLAPGQMLFFRLDGRRCAIAAPAVVEILAAVATSPLPGQPGYIAGVIDLRARDSLLALWIDE